MLLHLSQTKQSRSHPGSKVALNRGNIQNLVILIQDQLLHDVGQRLERFEVGVLVRNQFRNFLQDVPLHSSLLT